MKKCKSCKTEIDSNASKCPHCQTDQRSWFRKHPIITVILLLIIVGIIGSSGSKKETSDATLTDSNTEASASIQPTEVLPEKVNVKSFVDEFEENQVAAEAKWSGKLIEFSAKISNITDSGISFQNVSSKEFSLAQISCRIEDKQQLMTLKNGQMVTVSGIVGDQTIGVIDIGKCKVVN